MAILNYGSYSKTIPDGIHRHNYAGGGHAGCGGYIEALEIESIHGPIFLLHEFRDEYIGYRSSDRRQQYRWRRFDQGADMLQAFDATWCSNNRDGFTEWIDKPFWEAVNYNDTPYETC